MASSIKDFKVGQLLGKGGFASVYIAVNERQGSRTVAIKMIEKMKMREHGMIEKVKNEASIHYRLKHPNILELYDCFEDDNYVYLELEYCKHGELGKYLHRHGKPPILESEACSVIRQVLEGLLYLHGNGIVHRDLTLSNLLLNDKNQMKIADFGLATKLSRPGETHMTMCGTPNYISPEVATKSPHGPPVDVWGLGVLLYTLLIGQPPFDTPAIHATLKKVVKEDFHIPTTISNEAANLLRRLLDKDQDKRIAARDIAFHPFMRKYPDAPLHCGVDQDSGVNMTCSACSRIDGARSRCGTSNNGMQSMRSREHMSHGESCCHSERDQLVGNSLRALFSKSRSNDLQGYNLGSSRSGCGRDLNVANTNSFDRNDISKITSDAAISGCSRSRNFKVETLATNSSTASNSRPDIVSLPRKPDKISTERLRETSGTIGKDSFKILRTGHALIERSSEKAKFRFEVTGDGNEIFIEECKSKRGKPTVITEQRYTYDNLPQKWWTKYGILKEFVKSTQSCTVKLSLGTKMAAFSLMEDSPESFSASFFTGCQFDKLGNEVTVTSATTETYLFERLRQLCRNATSDQTHHFIESFHLCLALEQIIKEQAMATGAPALFPASFGAYHSVPKRPQFSKTSTESERAMGAGKMSPDVDTGRASKLPASSTLGKGSKQDVVRASSTPVKKLQDLSMFSESSNGSRGSSRAVRKSQSSSGRTSKSLRVLTKTFEDGTTLSFNLDNGKLMVQSSNGTVQWFSGRDPDIPQHLVDKLVCLRQIASSAL